ncbi:hypothetical protein K503DRAFT_772109 [Rhizopogon vinicolor AM-OR11-026]|uniref:Uncharacterized protein n=1 Tax=Rhizopogon vinicolor AM-OR11-026 TaxID=1314800 RepID=A0A1B7MW33_9AGAM|nr:hypothetical protein K503DRAFT_772109 [Rhizopogon vinicolor AM-OR11-026]
MRFSFLLIIAALTASTSVSACKEYTEDCNKGSDCCSGLYCNFISSSIRILLRDNFTAACKKAVGQGAQTFNMI